MKITGIEKDFWDMGKNGYKLKGINNPYRFHSEELTGFSIE